MLTQQKHTFFVLITSAITISGCTIQQDKITSSQTFNQIDPCPNYKNTLFHQDYGCEEQFVKWTKLARPEPYDTQEYALCITSRSIEELACKQTNPEYSDILNELKVNLVSAASVTKKSLEDKYSNPDGIYSTDEMVWSNFPEQYNDQVLMYLELAISKIQQRLNEKIQLLRVEESIVKASSSSPHSQRVSTQPSSQPLLVPKNIRLPTLTNCTTTGNSINCSTY